MPEYIGANQANLAWVAWQRGDLVEAEQLAQAALDACRVHSLPYPLYWQAWLPLLSIALQRNSLDQAIELARQLLDPHQQKLPDPIESLLQQAIDASQADDAITTRRLLLDTKGNAESLRDLYPHFTLQRRLFVKSGMKRF
jgi:tetratricopeptide (TPR) repeat protein